MTHMDNRSVAENTQVSVTVIIVNFNGGDLICKCLAAVGRQRFRDFLTVVVDNNSTDNSVSLIREQHPSVAVVSTGANLGFAGGVNYALRHVALGRWVALLNPDAFPHEDWLGNLVSSSERHPAHAAFGSRMFSDPEYAIIDGIGDAYHLSGLPWRSGHSCADSTRFDIEREIFAPCAAAALYSTRALEEVGFFDEDFFLYVEDVDLGFRLQLAGYRAMYVPGAKIQHLGSAFVGKRSDSQIYHGHRNVVWAYVKNMPGILFWIFLPAHLALNIATVLWFSLRGRGNLILRSKWDALCGMPNCWAKRQKVQSTRRASAWSILKQLSWNPFKRYI